MVTFAPPVPLSLSPSTVTPSVAWLILPSRISVWATYFISFTGIAKPRPLALSESDLLAVLMPITSEAMLSTDGKAIKIASMIDEHTRLSLLNLVERSITAERRVAEPT